MPALTSNLGYPRIGENRELKSALEWHWLTKVPGEKDCDAIVKKLSDLGIPLDRYVAGVQSEEDLQAVAKVIRQRNWQTQKDAGIDLIPSNDFSLYDHVLDTSCLVGAVPERFDHHHGDVPLDTYFAMARDSSESPAAICCHTHDSVAGLVPLELRKWLGTNYQYLVPEFGRDQQFKLSSQKPFREFDEALALDIRTKPVLLGPISFLQLGKCKDEPFDRLELLERLLPVYGEVLQKLAEHGAEWVQLDEPTLVMDLSPEAKKAFTRAYASLQAQAPGLKILLGTYFGQLRENLELALSLPVTGLHIDAAESQQDAHKIIESRTDKTISVGVVDGRNVWKNDLAQSLQLLQRAQKTLGADRLIIAPSSSLLHVPYSVQKEIALPSVKKLGPDRLIITPSSALLQVLYSVQKETALPPDVRSWLAFAREKLQEVVTLREALQSQPDAIHACEERTEELTTRLHHPLVRSDSVRQETDSIEKTGVTYRAPSAQRRQAQASKLQLPSFPTTTIGSFPQTNTIRNARAKHRKGELSQDDYNGFLKKEIADVIKKQDDVGLDVLVHGESERNDMVQYFAEQLDGIACTENGWVQSFGSRYVRPPIIYGDVSRPKPITVEWSRYAQSLTDKPVKGMLTGPVTILHWSFVRDDVPEKEVCRQIALAMRNEVQELEAAGIRIIQIDEPALREGLPLRQGGREDYLQWTTDAFRLTVNQVKPETQIHTHTCYGDVRDILPVLRDLDVDVISIEAARSRLAFLDVLESQKLPYDIGPGIWDIHSPRVPSTDELVQLIELARKYVPDDQLWINPDCGLKTRSPEQTWATLRNLVEAARITRATVFRSDVSIHGSA